MFKKLTILVALIYLNIGIHSNVYADTKPKNEQLEDYISQAQPYLHLSCEGLVNALNEDEEQIEKAIGLMLAVSLINRNIDITKLIKTKDAEGEFRELMEKGLKKQCENDVQSLMISNVDRVVVYAFGERPQKAE